MEKFQIARKEALRRIKAADHMLTQTFNLVKDTRLLISVFSNLRIGVESTVASILHYDRAFKKIPPFHDNFGSKLNHFSNTSARLHKMERWVPFLAKINELFERHKGSPIEFTKNNSFIICDDHYNLRTVTVKDLKQFIDDAKQFYAEAEKITIVNEKIFNEELEDV